MTRLISLVTLSLFGAIAYADTTQPIDTMDHDVTQGALRVKTEDEIVECPLKHTDVKVIISGFIARAIGDSNVSKILSTKKLRRFMCSRCRIPPPWTT